MGNEMSCPCTSKDNQVEETTANPDYLAELEKFTLTTKQMIYDKWVDNFRVCLLHTDLIESFFKTREMLKIPYTDENIKYYNEIYLCNYLSNKETTFIYLRYEQESVEENTRFPRKSINSFVQRGGYDFDNYSAYGGSGSLKLNRDYNASYKVNTFNICSNSTEKIKKQILSDLNSKLAKDFIFLGIVNDCEKYKRSYKIVFKKTMKVNLISSIDYFIYADTDGGNLSESRLDAILSQHKDKNLRGVMIDFLETDKVNDTYSKYSKDGGIKKIFYYIFEVIKSEGDTPTPNSPKRNGFAFGKGHSEMDLGSRKSSMRPINKNIKLDILETIRTPMPKVSYEYLVTNPDKRNSPDQSFVVDVGKKVGIVKEQGYNLCCIVCDNKEQFFIFNKPSTELDYDTQDLDLDGYESGTHKFI